MSEPIRPNSPLATPVPWELVAPAYDRELRPFFQHYSAEAVRAARLPAGAEILDVAAGPGTLSLEVAREARRVVAIDFSEAMIATLRENVRAAGLANVESRVGDGQALPFGDESFDGAFSMFGLMFFPEVARGFSELRRVLRPGGRAVVSGWAPLDRVPLFVGMFEALSEAMPELPLKGHPGALASPEEIRAEMTAAGFREIEVREVTHGWDAATTDEAWGFTTRTAAPFVMLRKNLGEERWATLDAKVREHLREHLGPGQARYEMTALLGIGTR